MQIPWKYQPNAYVNGQRSNEFEFVNKSDVYSSALNFPVTLILWWGHACIPNFKYPTAYTYRVYRHTLLRTTRIDQDTASTSLGPGLPLTHISRRCIFLFNHDTRRCNELLAAAASTSVPGTSSASVLSPNPVFKTQRTGLAWDVFFNWIGFRTTNYSRTNTGKSN